MTDRRYESGCTVRGWIRWADELQCDGEVLGFGADQERSVEKWRAALASF